MKNPYVWNTINPDLCYGRDKLLSDLLGGLPGSPRYSFGVAGGRRMGKTTLLRRVERDLRAGVEQWRSGGLLVIPIYIDGLVLPCPLAASDVWTLLFRELQSALPGLSQPFESFDFDGFKTAVASVLPNLLEHPRIIVMFDEIEPIVVCDWADSFLSQWRALLSNTPELSEYFTAVFAGAQEMAALRRDIGSPLKDILEWRNLRSLAYEEACRLMQEPIELEWPEPFLRRVYRETGGHPMLLQYVMHHICQDPPGLANQSLEQAMAKFVHERRWQFAEWWGRFCSPTAQRIYDRLPDDGRTMHLRTLTQQFGLNEANDALEILQHVGLVAAEEEEFAFRYAGEMFRQWYRQYGTLAESPLHDFELHARLANVGTNLADKYISAWKIYQTEEIPNYSGVVHEIRDILTLLLDTIAPNGDVMAETGFKLEAGRNNPTRRQRVRYAVRRLYDPEHAKEIASDFDLLEILYERLAQAATGAYRRASDLAHNSTPRERAYRVLKQWEGLLAQLLPER